MAWQILELQKRFVNRNYILGEIIGNMVTHYVFHEENLHNYPMNAEISLNWCRGFYHNVYEPNEKYITEATFNQIAANTLAGHNIPSKGIIPSMSLKEFMEEMKKPVEHLPNEETCGATPAGYIPPITSPDWPVEITDYFDDVEAPLDVDSDTNHSRYGGMKKAIGVELNEDDYDMDYTGSKEDNEKLGIGVGREPLKPIGIKEDKLDTTVEVKENKLDTSVEVKENRLDTTTVTVVDKEKSDIVKGHNEWWKADVCKKRIEEVIEKAEKNIPKDLSYNEAYTGDGYFWQREGNYNICYMVGFKDGNYDTMVPIIFSNGESHDVYKYHLIVLTGILVVCENGNQYLKPYDTLLPVEPQPKNVDHYIYGGTVSTSKDENNYSNIYPQVDGQAIQFGKSYTYVGDPPKVYYDDQFSSTTYDKSANVVGRMYTDGTGEMPNPDFVPITDQDEVGTVYCDGSGAISVSSSPEGSNPEGTNGKTVSDGSFPNISFPVPSVPQTPSDLTCSNDMQVFENNSMPKISNMKNQTPEEVKEVIAKHKKEKKKGLPKFNEKFKP